MKMLKSIWCLFKKKIFIFLVFVKKYSFNSIDILQFLIAQHVRRRHIACSAFIAMYENNWQSLRCWTVTTKGMTIRLRRRRSTCTTRTVTFPAEISDEDDSVTLVAGRKPSTLLYNIFGEIIRNRSVCTTDSAVADGGIQRTGTRGNNNNKKKKHWKVF